MSNESTATFDSARYSSMASVPHGIRTSYPALGIMRVPRGSAVTFQLSVARCRFMYCTSKSLVKYVLLISLPVRLRNSSRGVVDLPLRDGVRPVPRGVLIG